MKGFSIQASGVVLVILLLSAGAGAQDPQLPIISGTSIADIYAAGAELVKKLEIERQEVVHIEYDIVTRGTTTSAYRILTDRWTYTIMGFCDFRILDLDITVSALIDSVWVPVAHDLLADRVPIVTVTPEFTGLHRIDISAYVFDEGYGAGHYGFMVYHIHPDAEAAPPDTSESVLR